MAEVPVIDFAPFLHGGKEGKAKVAAEIRAACEDTGFLYLRGHGVPRPASVLGVLSKEHVADAVAESVSVYPR